jgi:hypothetical protein
MLLSPLLRAGFCTCYECPVNFHGGASDKYTPSVYNYYLSIDKYEE